MTKRHGKRSRASRPASRARAMLPGREAAVYRKARQFVDCGRYAEARRCLEELRQESTSRRLRAAACNDLAALATLEGDLAQGREGFREALAIDGQCEPARTNLSALESTGPAEDSRVATTSGPARRPGASQPISRIAILSLLFNWPSTGGGTVHTFELAQFLRRAGYDVRHFYASYQPWGIGIVPSPLPYPAESLVFDDSTWNAVSIQRRFREAVARFDPDHVIITDSWNFKPLLAEAVQGYPFILRFQALECLCPLNNVRLLPPSGGGFQQCELNQLVTPEHCLRCLEKHGHSSGSLHQAERALSGVGSPQYYGLLRQAYQEAEAVFVVNPPTAAMVSPYAGCVRISPAGMDPARFPWPWPEEPAPLGLPGRTALFFAGLVEEAIKGFHVLHEACARLWGRRQDFQLFATADPPGQIDAFTRYIGWKSQEELPGCLRAADICAVPTIAQEALGRTAVEAMAAGRPVIASRLGGLPWTVAEGVTGLLCEPGDPEDLARKIEVLLDDPDLRRRMGEAGRRRFDEHFSWNVIIDRDYRPLLRPRCRRGLRSEREEADGVG